MAALGVGGSPVLSSLVVRIYIFSSLTLCFLSNTMAIIRCFLKSLLTPIFFKCKNLLDPKLGSPSNGILPCLFFNTLAGNVIKPVTLIRYLPLRVKPLLKDTKHEEWH